MAHGPKPVAGFSLLELMIAVVIVGILLAVAIPSYQGRVVEANRRQAQADLMSAAQAAENTFATAMSYSSIASSPPFATSSPATGDARYTLSAEATATTFTITATPIANTVSDGDGLMQINHLGQRFWDKNNDGDTSDAGESSWEE